MAIARMPAARRLLAEGSNDFHVIAALLKYHDIPQDIDFPVPESRGVEALLRDLRSELAASELQILGLVIDANSDIQERWGTTRRRFYASGYDALPETPDPNGTIIHQADRPSVGV